jgi:hypothetical protein
MRPAVAVSLFLLVQKKPKCQLVSGDAAIRNRLSQSANLRRQAAIRP